MLRSLGRQRPTRRGVVLAAALALVVAAGVSVDPASSRRLATCTPIAYVPAVQDQLGQGIGETSCQAGSPTWQYTIQLKNRAGSVLTQTGGGPFSGNRLLATNWTGCSGAILHTFLYINVGGTGKSDTSGETLACSY